MGYDNRFHIVQRYSKEFKTEINGKTYYPAEVIATYEACGMNRDAVWELRNRDKATDITFLDEVYKGEKDGKSIYNCEYITEDCYGEPLTEFTIPEAIAILRKAERNEHYRRNVLLLGMLLAIDEAEWGDIRVLHYGH